jgi:hypothetical protein
MQLRYLNITLIMALFFLFSACNEEWEYEAPVAKTHFQNDAIKRTRGPNLVGLDLEFVYAMALGVERGKIISAQVEASIPGAAGTYIDHRIYRTNDSGIDVGTQVAEPSTTTGAKTTVTLTKDTSAAAFRYYYIIPEEARGKSVSFTFSARASTGETVSFNLGPYHIAKMEMKRLIVLSDNNLNYFSIADMQAYNAADAATHADKIDLVYLYRAITGITFLHALVAPDAGADFLPGITLPTGVNRTAKIHKVWELRDRHLAQLQYGIYVDDWDFEVMDISTAPNYAINLRAESGVWVETADGKYRAYIYVNGINNSARTMTISIKRYTVF